MTFWFISLYNEGIFKLALLYLLILHYILGNHYNTFFFCFSQFRITASSVIRVKCDVNPSNMAGLVCPYAERDLPHSFSLVFSRGSHRWSFVCHIYLLHLVMTNLPFIKKNFQLPLLGECSYNCSVLVLYNIFIHI